MTGSGPNRTALEGLRIERAAKPAPRQGGRRWILVVAAVVAAAAIAAWLATRPRPLAVRVAEAQAGGAGGGAQAAGTVLNASGYVTARRQATVSSKVTGKVTEVLIEEGMKVQQGQVLARLDTLTQDAALRLAEAQLVQARAALDENEVRLRQSKILQERQHRLLAGGFATQNEVDNADADVDSYVARLKVGHEQVAVAEREVASRRQDMADTVIRAPFAGVITTKDAQPGEMISPISAGGGFTRTGIGTLVDMGSLEIDVDVSESYINRVTDGQHAEAVLDAYPDWRIPATVIAVVPSADRQKATVKVRLSFDHLDPRILPDMGIKVAFLAPAEPAAAGALATAPAAEIRVPRAAVRQDGGQAVVFVVQGDHVERRAVRVAPGTGDEAALTAGGLAAGDRVVVEGPPNLVDGSKVAVQAAAH
jgi:HlyD family secretion protein